MNDDRHAAAAWREADLRHVLHNGTNLLDHLERGPHVFVRGQGVRLWDADGHEYLDATSGLANCNLGYGEPELIQAAADQLARLSFAPSTGGMANPPYVTLAQRIAGLLPDDLSRVFMTTTGSDANEAAFKLARWVNHLEGRPEKHKIISLLQSFHGNTLATTAATGLAVQWSVGAPLPPGFLHVEPPFCYRCPWHVGRRNDRCCLLGVEALEALIQREGPDTVAAIVAEPVLQAAGGLVPPPEYFPAVRRLCDRYGILLIYDEVVTGFGRTGKLFGLEHFDAVPDMVTMAKGLAAGHFPVGALAFRESLYERLLAAARAGAGHVFYHTHTFFGNPVAGAVGLKAIELLERQGLVQHAAAMGERLLAGLETLRDTGIVGDVRGIGLLAGVELVQDPATGAPFDREQGVARQVYREAADRGVLVRASAFGDVIMLTPPLIMTADEIDQVVITLQAALTAVREQA